KFIGSKSQDLVSSMAGSSSSSEANEPGGLCSFVQNLLEEQEMSDSPSDDIPCDESSDAAVEGMGMFQWVKIFTSKLGLDALRGRLRNTKILCAEACAGACTGTYILKELSEHLGFNTSTSSVSEPDPVKRAWISNNFGSRIDHHFKYVSEQRMGGFCLQHNQDCTCPDEEDLLLAGPPCQPYSRLSSLKRRVDWNPFDDPKGEAFLDTTRYIRHKRPAVAILEEVADVMTPWPSTCQGTFFHKYKCPLDFMLSGEMEASGEKVGLNHIPNYWLTTMILETSHYQVPQTRKRLYMVLARKDVCSEEVVVNLPEIAGKVLSEAMREASRRPTIQEIMAHNRQVLQILERRPTFPAVSQDGKVSKSTKLLVKSFKKNLGVSPYGPVECYSNSEPARSQLNNRERDCVDVHYASLQASGIDPEKAQCNVDVARSIGRRHIGKWGRTSALTRFVKIWDFESQSFLSGEDLLTLQGFQIEKLRLDGMKYSDLAALSGDSWTVPVAGALITTVLAFLLPYKLGKKAPILLSDFLTHNDFPITESEWSFIPSPGEVSNCSDSEPEPHVEPVPLPKVKPFSRTLTS
ncbi:Hypothetical protein (Fragment), partial [Durusdinium trenchii]